MSCPSHSPRQADVLVVGSGVAGLSVALSLRGYRVRLLTKTYLGKGSSSIWAQGGVAVAVGPEDSPSLHAQDTLSVSGGIADPEAVAILTQEGPDGLHHLITLGAQFDRHGTQLALGQEAAHSQARIVHAHGDATGAEMVRTLVQAVHKAPWIEVVEATCADDLLIRNQRIIGLIARQGTSRQVHLAKAVVLATGGIGQLFTYTTNPPQATADGLAIAARAGVQLADMEFVQFHPTALAAGADPMPLLTEALRGAGATLINDIGHRFMHDEHPAGELAPRDVVARAIWRQLQTGQHTFLDARTAIGPSFPERFPTVFRHCQQHGLDPRRDLLPVTPAAHYHMGGIAVNLHGRTSIDGLWACGEVAATGVHGANRLASNSLLEALVFGRRVGLDLSRYLPHAAIQPTQQSLPQNRPTSSQRLTANDDQTLRRCLREIMWQHVGLVRTEASLLEALQGLRALQKEYQPEDGEARNMLTVGTLIAAAALLRRESRGAHFRADYTDRETHWEKHSLWTAMELEAIGYATHSRELAALRGDAR